MAKKNKSNSYGGFILTFEPERSEWLKGRLYRGTDWALTESFSTLDWDLDLREVAFLAPETDPPELAAIVLMEPMKASGGFVKRKMRASEMVVFDPPIREQELSIHDLGGWISTPETLKRVDPTVWEQLLNDVRRARPGDAGDVDRILAMRDAQWRLVGDSQRVARLNEQRDGLGISLEIAQIDREPVLKAIRPDQASVANSILDLLDALPTYERELLEHDKRIFEELLGVEPTKGVVFHGAGKRMVRVSVVDHTDLEAVLGIDLIIYNLRYDSFLLLQYKRMQKGPDSWAYAVNPSSNLHQQLERMRAFGAKVGMIDRQAIPPPTLWSHRLSENPFYFKFCEELRASARDTSLIPGITMGAPHLDEFLALPEAKGKHGGISVGYQNCPRYLNNTEFIDLARAGWIGGGRREISLIKDVLQANQLGKRAAMLAVIDGAQGVSAQDRGWKGK